MSRALTVYFDGMCEPNPGGTACWAWIAFGDGERIGEASACFGHGPGMTSNLAEYEAALGALAWMAKKRGDFDAMELVGDSQLVVHQIGGRWKCNAEHLRPLCASARALAKDLGVVLRWVPREENVEADALCQKAYRETRAVRVARRAKCSTEDSAKRRAHVKLTDTVTLYWTLAKWAISQKLLTEDQAKLIARIGTRKQSYWVRHVIDLCGVIADRGLPNDESTEGQGK